MQNTCAHAQGISSHHVSSEFHLTGVFFAKIREYLQSRSVINDLGLGIFPAVTVSISHFYSGEIESKFT